MNRNNYCIIMAGGIGTRFWPMSKNSKPKQFIDILGTGKTLIQLTFERFSKIIPTENIFIVANKVYEQIISEQLPALDKEQIILEPSRKNTAPCIAYATYKLNKINPSANIIVSPSDHLIHREQNFLDTITLAFEATRDKDILMTLGIKPSRPDTGYGYIQYRCGNSKNKDNNLFKNKNIKKVKTFTEKPHYDLAVSFLESGDFLWNSGIFIWSLKSIKKALELHLPDISNLFISADKDINTENESQAIEAIYAECRSISIDYGVMEKASNVYVFISDFDWCDLGTWGSLHEHRNRDENNNAVHGKNVMLYDTKDSIVHMPTNKLAVIQGLENYIVVESEHILLICKKNDEQKIRQFVNDVLFEKGEQYV